jgi:hypothetical protein
VPSQGRATVRNENGELMGRQSIRQEARLAALDSQSKGRRSLPSATRPDVRPDLTPGRDYLAASRLSLGPTLRHDGELSTVAGRGRHQDRVRWLDGQVCQQHGDLAGRQAVPLGLARRRSSAWSESPSGPPVECIGDAGKGLGQGG